VLYCVEVQKSVHSISVLLYFFREKRVIVEIRAQLVQLEREEYVHFQIIYFHGMTAFHFLNYEKNSAAGGEYQSSILD